MSEDVERWKTDGNCAKCRRREYCSKACTAQKRRAKAIIAQMIRERTGAGYMRETLRGAGSEL